MPTEKRKRQRFEEHQVQVHNSRRKILAHSKTIQLPWPTLKCPVARDSRPGVCSIQPRVLLSTRLSHPLRPLGPPHLLSGVGVPCLEHRGQGAPVSSWTSSIMAS